MQSLLKSCTCKSSLLKQLVRPTLQTYDISLSLDGIFCMTPVHKLKHNFFYRSMTLTQLQQLPHLESSAWIWTGHSCSSIRYMIYLTSCWYSSSLQVSLIVIPRRDVHLLEKIRRRDSTISISLHLIWYAKSSWELRNITERILLTLNSKFGPDFNNILISPTRLLLSFADRFFSCSKFLSGIM